MKEFIKTVFPRSEFSDEELFDAKMYGLTWTAVFLLSCFVANMLQ